MENDDLNALNLTDGDIIHRQKIVQLLKMGIAQQWAFSYVKKIKNRVTTNSVRLVSVYPDEGIFSIQNDGLKETIKPGETLMFRGQSGGLSVVFQASMSDVSSGEGGKSSSNIHFQIPYKIACTQLRKTLRINLESVSEIPVTVYMVNGAIVEGTVMDVSSSGAKFRAEQNLEKEDRKSTRLNSSH